MYGLVYIYIYIYGQEGQPTDERPVHSLSHLKNTLSEIKIAFL